MREKQLEHMSVCVGDVCLYFVHGPSNSLLGPRLPGKILMSMHGCMPSRKQIFVLSPFHVVFFHSHVD